ncbi:MAG: hypothetical protein ACRYFX_29885 [Janthinobacterium lividum]
MPSIFFRLALLAAGLAVISTSRAQTPATPTAAGLKKNFALIEAGTEGESESFDKLTTATARQLVAYLKTHEMTAKAAKSMGLDYTDSKGDARFKVFTYSYSSGGTRGTIHRPVFQWKNAAGQLFAYSSAEECYFSEIHQLASPGRTLYLLLGGDKGDGQCDNNEAYVVELKGNYLLVDKAAFGKKPLLRLCNVPMTFDASKQLLQLDLTDYSTEHDETLPPEWERPRAKSLTLKFNGGRFVQSR